MNDFGKLSGQENYQATPTTKGKRHVRSPKSTERKESKKTKRLSVGNGVDSLANSSVVTWDTSPLSAERIAKSLLGKSVRPRAKEFDDVAALFGTGGTKSKSEFAPKRHWNRSSTAIEAAPYGEHRLKTPFKKSLSYHGIQSPTMPELPRQIVDPIEKLWQQTMQQMQREHTLSGAGPNRRSFLLSQLHGKSFRSCLTALKNLGVHSPSSLSEWDERSLCQAVEQFEKLLVDDNWSPQKTPTKEAARNRHASESVLESLKPAVLDGTLLVPSSDGYDFDNAAIEDLLHDSAANSQLDKLLDEFSQPPEQVKLSGSPGAAKKPSLSEEANVDQFERLLIGDVGGHGSIVTPSPSHRKTYISSDAVRFTAKVKSENISGAGGSGNTSATGALMAGPGPSDAKRFEKDLLSNSIQLDDLQVAPESDSFSIEDGLDEELLEPELLVLLNGSSDGPSNGSTDGSEVKYVRAKVQRVSVKGTHKELSVKLENSQQAGETASVQLYGAWAETEVEPGAHVNVVDFKPEEHKARRYVLGTEGGQAMLVLHPDLLFTGTSLAESTNCTRKAYLDTRVRSATLLTEAMVYGNMIHELLQEALAKNNFSESFLLAAIDEIIIDHAVNLWAADVSELGAKEQLLRQAPELQKFAAKYLGQEPGSEATIVEHRCNDRLNLRVAIRKVKAIEENAWSPIYGIKGKIDATVEVALVSDKLNGGRVVVNLLPLEIKTGNQKGVVSHRAQTLLYSLLLQDAYKIKSERGLLYYQKTGQLLDVPVIQHELESIVQARNRLAHYTSSNTMPPMLMNRHHCERCFSRENCFIYHKAVEGGNFKTAGVSMDAFETITGQIEPKQAAFLQKWDRLLALEEKTLSLYKEEIWLLTSHEREKLHRCLGNLVLTPNRTADVARFGRKGSFHLFSMTRSPTTSQSESLLHSSLIPGDPIIVSSESGRIAIAIGFVVYVYSDRILVRVDNTLTPDPLPCPEQFSPHKRHIFIEPDGASPNRTLYRIDKDELTTEMHSMRGHLVQLCRPSLNETTGNVTMSKLSRLVIDLKVPAFKSVSDQLMDKTISNRLNEDQKVALDMMLRAEDYLMVLGMPGTGKTTAIAAMIETLVSQGKTVLLTAYTHSAVDNVLLKVLQEAPNINFMRLGQANKVHPSVLPYCPEKADFMTTVDGVNKFFESKRLIATTALGLRHPMILKRRFDYVIVDEASQLTLPVCLGPLLLGDRFILVGDHYQLPPLVRHEQARREGLQNSLFKQLCEAHPTAVASLTYQYRMNSEIMMLSNKLVYGNRLRCGSDYVRRQRLHLPLMWPDKVEPGWLREVLNPEAPVLFLNTESVPALESRNGDVIENHAEARLVFLLVAGLLASGIPVHDIGVITPYRAQLRLLHGYLEGFPLLELNTVDKYQGRDKQCIIVSFVRSNPDRVVGELLNDWRRLNVAFTRAKAKLVLVGSKETLSASQLLVQFLTLLKEHSCIYDKMPCGADRSNPMLWKLYRKLKQQGTLASSPTFFQKPVNDTSSITSSVWPSSGTQANGSLADGPALKLLSSSPTRSQGPCSPSVGRRRVKQAKSAFLKILDKSPTASLIVRHRLDQQLDGANDMR